MQQPHIHNVYKQGPADGSEASQPSWWPQQQTFWGHPEEAEEERNDERAGYR